MPGTRAAGRGGSGVSTRQRQIDFGDLIIDEAQRHLKTTQPSLAKEIAAQGDTSPTRQHNEALLCGAQWFIVLAKRYNL